MSGRDYTVRLYKVQCCMSQSCSDYLPDRADTEFQIVHHRQLLHKFFFTNHACAGGKIPIYGSPNLEEASVRAFSVST